MSKLSEQFPAGVLTGDAVQDLFELAKAKNFAMPAPNVVGTNTANVAMETAARVNSPIIITLSNGGAQFFAGKGMGNEGQKGAIAGGVAGAHHVHMMAAHYGARVIMHTDHAAKKLLPWIDGLLDAGEAFFKVHGIPLYSSHMLDLLKSRSKKILTFANVI